MVASVLSRSVTEMLSEREIVCCEVVAIESSTEMLSERD